MTSQLRSAAAVLLAVLALAAPGPLHAQASGEVGPALGSQAPEAAVEDLDGNPVELLDYTKGKPALLEFWATWCEKCAALQPQMDQIQAQFGDRLNVVAVAVAVAQSVRRVKRHLEDHDPGYAYVWDGKGNAVRAFKAPTTSVVVILDAQGRVAYTGVGADQDLLGAVRAVLAAQ